MRTTSTTAAAPCSRSRCSRGARRCCRSTRSRPTPRWPAPGWRDAWLERIDSVEPYEYEWLRHQRRDDYWKQGSVCEDFAAIECPVYAIGGWADGYSEAVLRLLAGPRIARKGLLGPWSHAFPDDVEPGPCDRLPPGVPALVGPLAEGRGHRDRRRARAARMDAGARRVPPRASWSGRAAGWRSRRWPSPQHRGAAGSGSARRAARRARRRAGRRLEIGTDLLCGLDGGVWCADGTHGEGAVDQRADDGRALSFTPQPAARAHRAARKRARGARAGERPPGRAAGGAALRRLSRRQLAPGHARRPQPHPPQQPRAPGAARARASATRVVLELDGIAQAIPAGHRAPPRALARLLALAVAGAGAGHARDPHRRQLARAAGPPAARRGRASSARSTSPSRRPASRMEKLEPVEARAR